jgi:segregation and condensation protein B
MESRDSSEPMEPLEAAETEAPETVAAGELFPGVETGPDAQSTEDARLKALLEAVVYVAEEPLTLDQIAAGIGRPREQVQKLLESLVADFDKPEHGVTIRVVAGGYKMATKAEHHESVRSFVKSLKAPLKLSLPALETLAVVAYKQPVTSPEIMEIRGVQGAGVLKTLLDRKLIAAAGRKNVIGKPILYKTTKEFLIQFGLKDLSELPSLKEFEDIRRMAISDGEMTLPPAPTAEQPTGPAGETLTASSAPEAGTALEIKNAPEVGTQSEADVAVRANSAREGETGLDIESAPEVGTEAGAEGAATAKSAVQGEPRLEIEKAPVVRTEAEAAVTGRSAPEAEIEPETENAPPAESGVQGEHATENESAPPEFETAAVSDLRHGKR